MSSQPSSASDIDDLLASIELTPIATVVTDPTAPDNPIIACNAAFQRLTGYAREDSVGRNCRFLSGPQTSAEARAVLRTAIHENRPALCEMINYRKDGSAFRNAVMIAPVLGESGNAVLYIGSQMEVPGDDAAEARRAAARQQVDTLSRRQRQVLQHLVAGFRNKQIAAELGIDEKTVKMHRAAMLDRLGCDTSADAIRTAVIAGLADELQ